MATRFYKLKVTSRHGSGGARGGSIAQRVFAIAVIAGAYLLLHWLCVFSLLRARLKKTSPDIIAMRHGKDCRSPLQVTAVFSVQISCILALGTPWILCTACRNCCLRRASTQYNLDCLMQSVQLGVDVALCSKRSKTLQLTMTEDASTRRSWR